MITKPPDVLVNIKLNDKGFQKGAERTKSSLAGIAISVGAVAGAFKALDSTLARGLKSQGVFQALPFAIDNTTRALGGMVSEMDVAMAASKQSMLGLNLTQAQFTKLAKEAAIAGQAMGISATQSLNDIITGIGRGSKLILDNLGLIVEQTKANEAWAKSNGRVVSSLTDAEKKMAFQAEALQQLTQKTQGLKLNTTGLAAEWARAKTDLVDFGDELARTVSRMGQGGSGDGSGAIGAIQSLTIALGALAGQTAKSRLEMVRFKQAMLKDIERKGGADVVSSFFSVNVGALIDANRAEEKILTNKVAQVGAQKTLTRLMKDQLRLATQLAGGKKGGKKGGSAAGEGPGPSGFSMASRRDRSVDEGEQWQGALDTSRGLSKQEGPLLAINDMTARLIEQNAQLDQSYKDMAMGGLASFATGMWGAIDAAVSGGESFPLAMLKMSKGVLMGIAQQATVKALFQMAEGYAMLANPLTMALAPGHFFAAKAFGVTAVAAGVAGIGLGAIAGSMSSGSAAKKDRTSTGNIPRSGSSSGRSQAKAPPVVINIRYDRSDPHAIRMASAKVKAEIMGAGNAQQAI